MMKNTSVFVILVALLSYSCNSNALKQSERYNNLIINDFTIDNSKDTILKGTEGTILKIPAFCFTDSVGNVISKSIKITLNEVFTKEAMISNHTVTQDLEGNVLESSGMMKIDICDKEHHRLKIAPEKQIEVQFARSKILENSKLYKGKEKNGDIFWEEIKGNENKSEWFEMVETIIQRPFKDAHLGDSMTVEYFKLIVEGKDIVKIKVEENEVPQEFLRRRKLYSATLSIYSPFYIKETGWYNVDKLLIEDKNNQFSKIELQLKNTPKNPNQVDLKLALKERNILLDVFFDKELNRYAFGYEQDGKVLLPQKEKAYIIAVCYHGQDIYFTNKEVETNLSMKYDLTLEKISTEELKTKMGKIFPK